MKIVQHLLVEIVAGECYVGSGGGGERWVMMKKHIKWQVLCWSFTVRFPVGVGLSSTPLGSEPSKFS